MSQAFDDSQSKCTGPTITLPANGTFAMTVRPHVDQTVSGTLLIYATLRLSDAERMYMRNYTRNDVGTHVTFGGSETGLDAGYHTATGTFFGVAGQVSWPINSTWQHIIVTWADQGGGNYLVKSWFNGVLTGSVTASFSTLVGWSITVGGLQNSGTTYGCQADIAQVCLDSTVWSTTQMNFYQSGTNPLVISSTLVEWWPLIGCSLANSGSDTTALVASSSPHAPTCSSTDPTIGTPRVASMRIGPSGMTVVAQGDDSHGTLIGLGPPATSPTIVINGTSTVLDRWIDKGQYVGWLLPDGTVVRSTDTVTASIASGTWATSIGPTIAFSGSVDVSLAPVSGSNVATSSFLTPTIKPNLLRVGYNAPYIGGGNVPVFANLMRESGGEQGNQGSSGYVPDGAPDVRVAACTGGTTTTVTDTTVSWATNQYVGYPIYFVVGGSSGQSAVVTANDAHTITFSPAVSIAPVAGDVYDITRWTVDANNGGYPSFRAWASTYTNIKYAGNGTYTITWDASDFGDAFLTLQTPNTNSYVTASDTGHATGNSRTYTIGGGYGMRAVIGYALHIDPVDSNRITETGTWSSVFGSGYSNHYRQSDGLVGSQTTIDLGHLDPAGTYQIRTTWLGSSSNTSNATFTVQQGSTILSSNSYSQRSASAGSGALLDDLTNVGVNSVNVATGITPTGSAHTHLIIENPSADGFLVYGTFKVFRTDTTATPLSSAVTPITNVGVWAPTTADGTVTPGTTIAHPTFCRMIAGTPSLRTMPPFRAVDSALENYNQFPLPTDRTFGSTTDKLGGSAFPIRKIVKVENWGDPNNFWGSNYTYHTRGNGNCYSTVLCTLDAPHNWTTGVNLNAVVPTFTIPAADSPVGTVNLGNGPVEYDPTRMATNQIALAGYMGSTPISGPSIPTITGLNYLLFAVTQSVPPSYVAELVKPVSGCDIYVSVPANATQDCVTRMATDIANALPAGRKMLVSLGNEPWNSAFPVSAYFLFRSYVARALAAGNTAGACTTAHGTVTADGSSSVAKQYAAASILVHGWFKAGAALATGGDRSGDVRCGFESWQGDPTFTNDIINAANAASALVDYVTVARYDFSGTSDNGSMGPYVDQLNIEQVLDFVELSLVYDIGNNNILFNAHKALINGATSGEKQLFVYEESFEKPALPGSGLPDGQHRRISIGSGVSYPTFFSSTSSHPRNTVAALQSACASTHPRIVNIYHAIFDAEAGTTAAPLASRSHYYQFESVPVNENDPDGDCHWYSSRQWWNQPLGTGLSGEGNGGAYDPLPDLRGSSTLAGSQRLDLLAVAHTPTVNPTGGGASGGSLAAGTYSLVATETNGDGEQMQSYSVDFTSASGNIPRVTFGAFNPGGTSRAIYVKAPGSGGYQRYASAIITPTYDMAIAAPAGPSPPLDATTSFPLQPNISRSVSYIAGAIDSWNNFSLGPATSYSMTLSATTGPISTAMSVTITPNGTVTGTISVAVSSGEGFSTPMSFVFSGGSSPITHTNTPSTAGTATFTPSQSLGLTDPSAKTYVVTDPTLPTVTNVSPPSGSTAGGTVVVITGTTFSSATGVTFGGTSASFTIDSGTQITATAPARSAGVIDVVVTNTAGSSSTSSADQFTYFTPSTFHSSGRHTIRSGNKRTILIGG
jgi:hypothetical protein